MTTEKTHAEKTHVVWHDHSVSRESRERLNGHQGCVVWFTGLSGSGKSTVANLVDQMLYEAGIHSFLLDGDNVRHGLNKDLGFTDTDRIENIRRVAEVAKLMVDAGLIVMTAFISPFQAERRMARSLLEDGEFIEIHMDVPLAVAEQRDVKGLYKKARRGELKNFTGIDSRYETPEAPELRLATDAMSPEESVERIIALLRERGRLP
jgi:bifunctional enzyme CysN/CysC